MAERAGSRRETPDVERGDQVYFRHASGPQAGKVLARGDKGVTLEHEGRRHRVLYADLLGHKVRVGLGAKLVDSGEDGFVVEDRAGRRRYIHDPRDARAEDAKPMKKALILLPSGGGSVH